MNKETRDQKIKSIIKLEDRIAKCNRCASLIKCTSKPSLGKGDIEAEIMLVFECESVYTKDINWIIGLRNSIKEKLNINKIYHTFLVRCHPKSCTHSLMSNCSPGIKIVDRDEMCMLTKHVCDGILIKPFNEEIINCLTFLLEEIEILKPAYVILFGDRVGDFVLKSCGMVSTLDNVKSYKYESVTLLTTAEERLYNDTILKSLADIIHNQ
jgi:hypothetical protein